MMVHVKEYSDITEGSICCYFLRSRFVAMRTCTDVGAPPNLGDTSCNGELGPWYGIFQP